MIKSFNFERRSTNEHTHAAGKWFRIICNCTLSSLVEFKGVTSEPERMCTETRRLWDRAVYSPPTLVFVRENLHAAASAKWALLLMLSATFWLSHPWKRDQIHDIHRARVAARPREIKLCKFPCWWELQICDSKEVTCKALMVESLQRDSRLLNYSILK